MFRQALIISCILTALAGCSTVPDREPQNQTKANIPSPKTAYTLPDKHVFLQKDPRWSEHKLGGSGDSLASDGCLVTATAMSLANLGFETNPADLNKRLTQADGYTKQGWLKWASISDVTGGKAKARYYSDVSDEIIQGCMADGYYPLARFILPSGRSHWAMIVHRDGRGYHMRDPLRSSKSPLIFPTNASGFKAVRCVGLAQ